MSLLPVTLEAWASGPDSSTGASQATNQAFRDATVNHTVYVPAEEKQTTTASALEVDDGKMWKPASTSTRYELGADHLLSLVSHNRQQHHRGTSLSRANFIFTDQHLHQQQHSKTSSHVTDNRLYHHRPRLAFPANKNAFRVSSSSASVLLNSSSMATLTSQSAASNVEQNKNSATSASTAVSTTQWLPVLCSVFEAFAHATLWSSTADACAGHSFFELPWDIFGGAAAVLLETRSTVGVWEFTLVQRGGEVRVVNDYQNANHQGGAHNTSSSAVRSSSSSSSSIAFGLTTEKGGFRPNFDIRGLFLNATTGDTFDGQYSVWEGWGIEMKAGDRLFMRVENAVPADRPVVHRGRPIPPSRLPDTVPSTRSSLKHDDGQTTLRCDTTVMFCLVREFPDDAAKLSAQRLLESQRKYAFDYDDEINIEQAHQRKQHVHDADQDQCNNNTNSRRFALRIPLGTAFDIQDFTTTALAAHNHRHRSDHRHRPDVVGIGTLLQPCVILSTPGDVVRIAPLHHGHHSGHSGCGCGPREMIRRSFYTRGRDVLKEDRDFDPKERWMSMLSIGGIIYNNSGGGECNTLVNPNDIDGDWVGRTTTNDRRMSRQSPKPTFSISFRCRRNHHHSSSCSTSSSSFPPSFSDSSSSKNKNETNDGEAAGEEKKVKISWSLPRSRKKGELRGVLHQTHHQQQQEQQQKRARELLDDKNTNRQQTPEGSASLDFPSGGITIWQHNNQLSTSSSSVSSPPATSGDPRNNNNRRGGMMMDHQRIGGGSTSAKATTATNASAADARTRSTIDSLLGGAGGGSIFGFGSGANHTTSQGDSRLQDALPAVGRSGGGGGGDGRTTMASFAASTARQTARTLVNVNGDDFVETLVNNMSRVALISPNELLIEYRVFNAAPSQRQPQQRFIPSPASASATTSAVSPEEKGEKEEQKKAEIQQTATIKLTRQVDNLAEVEFDDEHDQLKMRSVFDDDFKRRLLRDSL